MSPRRRSTFIAGPPRIPWTPGISPLDRFIIMTTITLLAVFAGGMFWSAGYR